MSFWCGGSTMRWVMRQVLVALGLVWSCASMASAQLHVDYMEPPTSVSGLFEHSDAVVMVQVTGRHESLGTVSNRPQTDYTLIVLEKFKGDRSIPAHGPGLTVRRRGGLSASTAETKFAPFEPGEKYILFLRNSSDIAGLAPAYGPDGAIRVDPGGKLHPLGERAATSRSYRDAPADPLLAELRRLGS